MSSPHQFPRTTPEAEGMSSTAITAFVDALQAPGRPLDTVHSVMVLRHGNVVAEGWWSPYTADANHMMFSVSKSYCSTGIGIAVGEGLLSVEDTVLSFFPDDAPDHPSANLQAMKVKHLLAMNTGHHEDTTGAVFRGEGDDWARIFLSLPVEHEPGTWFVYNTGATYMLSAIITRLTGQTLLDYLTPRLFDPLGISGATWDTDPHGISIGGSGLHIRTEDIARLAQLYLQGGAWNGTRILSPDWVAEATSVHSDNSNTQTNPDWSVGYGYQFWRCRHGAYRGDGAFGQFCVVLPEQDAVLAITGGLQDMQAVLDKVWEHLLPAFGNVPLPPDPEAFAALQHKLANLTLGQPIGQAVSPISETLADRTWSLAPNALGLTAVNLAGGNDSTELTLTSAIGDQRVTASPGSWTRGSLVVPDPRTGVVDLQSGTGEPVAASGAWTNPTTYELWLAYVNGVYGQVWTFTFEEPKLRLTIAPNVSWAESEPITIDGHVIA